VFKSHNYFFLVFTCSFSIISTNFAGNESENFLLFYRPLHHPIVYVDRVFACYSLSIIFIAPHPHFKYLNTFCFGFHKITLSKFRISYHFPFRNLSIMNSFTTRAPKATEAALLVRPRR